MESVDDIVYLSKLFTIIIIFLYRKKYIKSSIDKKKWIEICILYTR